MDLDLRFYLRLLWRRLPVMLLLVLFFTSISAITAVRLPNTWDASARLLVEAPQIPQAMVRSTVQTEASEQLDIIQQRLLTRANLIDIANRAGVFENIRQMAPDQVFAAMQRSTKFRRSAGRDRATFLTISFTARTGEIAANVVNEYVTLILDENARFRISRAENTLDFFNQEVRRLSEDLDRQSADIAAFKTANADALPEDQSYRLNRQTLLQERFGRLERELASAQSRRDEVTRIFDRTGRIRPEGTVLSPEEQQLNQIRSDIEIARLTYSENHPRIVQLRNTEAALKANLAAREDASTGQDEGDDEATAEGALLEASMSDINNQVTLLQSNLDTTRLALTAVQDSISRSAANGIQLNTLERDYQNTQTRYNAALNNYNTAAMSERIETRAQGQRISAVENASVPSTPTGPNRMQIALLGALVGMALAVGYFLALEMLNRTVRRPSELVKRFNVVPIATIPLMENRRRRNIRRIGYGAATLAVAIMVPVGLWYVDQNFLPLELVVQRGLSQLGLG